MSSDDALAFPRWSPARLCWSRCCWRATAVLLDYSGGPHGGKIVITVRIWAEQIAAAYRQSFQAFTRAHPNIEVHTNVVAYSTYFNTLRTDVAGGSADDIFWLSSAYLAAYADSGRLMKIDAGAASDWELGRG